MPKVIQNGGFQNPLGTALTGNLLLVLSQDAKSAANPNQIAPIATRIPITAGNIAPTSIYFNDELLPGNTYYTMTAYDAAGNKTYGPEQVSFAGAGPLDLGTLVPLLISPDPLFSNPVLQNPTLSQTVVQPAATVLAVNGPGTLSLTATDTGAQTISGAKTFTGAFTTKNLWAEVWAASFAGATCGDKINAAVAAAPANGLVIKVNQACGAGTAAAPWAAVTIPGFVQLQFVEPGIYWITSITYSTVGGNLGAVVSGIPCATSAGATSQTCAVELHQGNSLNGTPIVMGMSTSVLRDIGIDGNAANNPTGGPCVKITAGSTLIKSSNIQNCATHGVWLNGPTPGSTVTSSIRLENVYIVANKADGVYALNTPDALWTSGSVSLKNGITATVNTTNTLITATSGSWSTDASLVGTMVRVNNAVMCQILGVPSTTTLTVAAATCWNASGVSTGLGVQTGVPFAMGNAWESNNSPTTRFEGGELSTSKMDGLLLYGTTAGAGSGRDIIHPLQFGNDGNYDIEIIGSCLDVQTSFCSVGNTISGANFIGSSGINSRGGVAGTYDFIKLIDASANVIAGNTFSVSGGVSQEKAIVESVESAASRAPGQGQVGLNSIIGTPTNPTGPYIDNTVGGTMGQEFPQHCGPGQGSAMHIFNDAPGATTPNKYICIASDGTFRLLNNSTAAILRMLDAGTMFLDNPGSQISIAGATSGAGVIQPPATGGVQSTLPQVAGVLSVTIASGTATMTTAAIGAGACGTTVTVAAAGVLATDAIAASFNAAPAGTNAGLVSWPTAGNVNFAYCPGVAETPAAATVNWRVVR